MYIYKKGNQAVKHLLFDYKKVLYAKDLSRRNNG